VYRRNKHYVYVIERGMRLAQKCPACRKRHWLARKPLTVCSRCGADLPEPTEYRRQEWSEAHSSAKAADRARRDALTALERGSFVPRSNETVAEFLYEWLEAIRATIRATTFASYRVNVEARIIPALGHVKLQALGPAALNRFYAELADAGLSAKTIRNIHVILHKALADAVRWGRISRNPASLADPPRATRPQMSVWTVEQIRAFLEHEIGERLFAAWLLLAMTGMRRGELLGLRWSDVDLDAGRAAVVQTLVLVDGKPEFSEPKTGRGRRQIAIDSASIAALRAHRARQAKERLAAGSIWVDSGLVFTREDGAPIHPEHLVDMFARRASLAGLPKIRLHDLRHSYATAALAAGISPKVVSERLGHATVAMTLDTYSHVLPSIDEASAERVAGLILGTGTAV
jgi:integrase